MTQQTICFRDEVSRSLEKLLVGPASSPYQKYANPRDRINQLISIQSPFINRAISLGISAEQVAMTLFMYDKHVIKY